MAAQPDVNLPRRAASMFVLSFTRTMDAVSLLFTATLPLLTATGLYGGLDTAIYYILALFGWAVLLGATAARYIAVHGWQTLIDTPRDTEGKGWRAVVSLMAYANVMLATATLAGLATTAVSSPAVGVVAASLTPGVWTFLEDQAWYLNVPLVVVAVGARLAGAPKGMLQAALDSAPVIVLEVQELFRPPREKS